MKSNMVTIGEFAKLVPGDPAPSTIWRWCRKGIKTRNGQQVRLPHQRVGKRLFVDASKASEFFKEIADQDVAYFQLKDGETRPEIAPHRTNAERTEAATRAAARLEREGL